MQERRHQQGFSLVEMLVVVFIIAMASTAVVLTLPEPRPDTEKHAQALMGDLTQAGRESIMAGEPIALQAEQNGYQFLRYREGVWTPLGRSVLFEPGSQAEESTTLSVTSIVESRRITPTEEQRRSNVTSSELTPDIVFYPVGEATPAQIVLEQAGRQSIIIVSEDASVRLAGVQR